jgi:drug/metabolite transporter superfamily protein YnfA
MHRHELDIVSLFAGVGFLAIAGGYALTHTTDLRLHWLIALPALMLLIGAAVVAMAVRRIVAGRVAAGPVADGTGDVSDST